MPIAPRRSRLRHAAAAVLSALALLPAARPALAAEGAPPYALGQGLRLGDSGFTLGGYLTAEVQQLSGQSAQLRTSNASVFLWWEGLERLKLLAEVDQENALVQGSRRPAADSRTERRTSLERLHVEWAFSDALAVRAGKFLTPVGRWNLAHAGPLVWTTNRPLLTQSVYPRNVTGVMAWGTLELGPQPLSWWLYGANGNEWEPDPTQDPYARVRGLRLLMPLGSAWQIGLSQARYEQAGSRGEPRTLVGLDLRWAQQGWEVSAEWLQTRADSPAPAGPRDAGNAGGSTGAMTGGMTPGGMTGGSNTGAPFPRQDPRGVPTRGAYVQGVMPLGRLLGAPDGGVIGGAMTGAVWVVLRQEWLRETVGGTALRLSTAGLVWRPHPATALKIEYQWPHGAAGTALQGWTASASVLF